MTARRTRPLLLACGVLAATLLTGCGIRPTEVPVDAGAPASRTACPNEVLVPLAPDTAAPSVVPGPTARPAPAATVPATPTPQVSPTGSQVFGAASPSHCP
ncbi:hypothetical protein [Streptomyces sp. TLI_171]|uniref:hypothetical protein n=1 Tax=Streptomyces sp. TLI_171 TaxID=1938859 RepID=UPI000C193F04|nr:hypothetical protein [Streptomyces sp. TLI_171]RKE19423.1 hypothetical protein BX266_2745 [Streptomyces sp. TLI_171]